MKLAETVTFGGSGLDRAAELRGKPDALAHLAAAKSSRVTLFWRQKPMVVDQGGCLSLVRVPFDHPILTDAAPEMIFLGREDGAGVWAADLSGWQPDAVDEASIQAFLDPTEQVHPNGPNGARFAELRAVMTRLSPRDCELAATARAIIGWHGSHRFCTKCGSESRFAMAGWQRDCATCDGHHFPRTDPVVIMLITHGNDVLMGRSPGWPEGMYSLLAGFVEPGETLEAAVRREVFEEAGIRVGPVSYLSSQPWPFPASLMFGCQGQATSRDITIDPVEIEDAIWVSRARMTEVFAGNDPQIKPAREGAIAHFLLWNWLADRLD